MISPPTRHKRRKIPRIEFFVENTIMKYNSMEFKSHFRLLPETFEYILEIIGPQISRNSNELENRGRTCIHAKKQLLLTLWMMATPDSYRSVCQKFNIGHATALRSVRRVTHALYRLAPVFIKWPTGELANEVAADFARTSAFPNVIGAIDGTHININAPTEDAQSYVNRKHCHSMQVQAVCTSNLLFTSVYAGNVGSVHDARVFKLSPVQKYINNASLYFANDKHIIGDAAYGIHKNVMVPYKDNGHLTMRERNFNFCLSSARMAIERAFGVWKGRWRSILNCLPMVTINKMPEYLLALAVLHNICILRNDILIVAHSQLPNVDIVQRGRLIYSNNSRQEGLLKRQNITSELIIRNI